MIFKIFNKKRINILNGFVEKAYVEGIYADTPANRKLGRVGMSYIEYAKMIKKNEENEEKKEKIKKEKPESIQDLFFKKIDGKKIATYSVNNFNVKIEIVSEEKYKDKQYKMVVSKKEEKDFVIEGNAAKIARQMKLLNNEQPFKHEVKNFRDILPLTSEELDKKWGMYYGFTYTYFKDNLDITVWKKDNNEDSKDPHFNIYVKDINTKKQKKFLNLSLKDAHEKLLEYDLNPNVEGVLTKSQLAEKKKILFKEKLKKGLKPSKDIGINFDENGIASFRNEKNNTALKVSINPNNPSQLTIHSYIIDRNYDKNYKNEPVEALILSGVGTTSVDKFKEFLQNYDLYDDISDENQVEKVVSYFSGTYNDPEGRKPKEIVESYANSRDLFEVPNIEYPIWDRVSAEKDPKVLKSIASKNFNYKYHRFNKGKIEVIKFVKSGALDKWLDSLPNSNKRINKSEISKQINDKVDRMKYNSEGFEGVDNLTRYIINKYY